jgi:hypothetical protein
MVLIETPKGDTCLVEKEQVCIGRTNTLSPFNPDQLIHQKTPVFWTPFIYE